jgi:hypothetical protein
MKKMVIALLSCVFSILNAEMHLDRYGHKTFVLTEDPSQSFPLALEVEKVAWASNIALNCSMYFDLKNITNFDFMQKSFRKQNCEDFTIYTNDRKKITCTYFDRKKDKTVIIGPGLTNPKEKMAPFAHIFLDYNVVLMNFRGQDHRNISLTDPKSYNYKLKDYLMRKTVEVDSDVKVGMAEHNEVFAVVDYLRARFPGKTYIGLGLCYGAYIFAKSQGLRNKEGKRLFDKLILDGCWISQRKYFEKILYKDPLLFDQPQRGGASDFTKAVMRQPIVDYAAGKIFPALLNIKLEDAYIPGTEYFKHIKIPVLFWHGKDELIVERHEFEAVWNSIQVPYKVGMITSSEHVWNHLRQKEVYSLASKLFIECNSPAEWTTHLRDKDILIDFISKELVKNAARMPDEYLFRPKKMLPDNNGMSALGRLGVGGAALAGAYAVYHNLPA